MLFSLLVLLVFIFTVAGQMYVAIKAFRKGVVDGIVCLVITWYAAYFVFKNSRTLFGDKLILKIWAVLAILFTLFLISIPLVEAYAVS